MLSFFQEGKRKVNPEHSVFPHNEKIIKLLEDAIGENLDDFEFGEDSLDTIPQCMIHERKT